MAIENWFDAVAKTASEIEGIVATFAGGQGGQGVDVQPMIDEELLQVPAAVLSYGGASILAGQWERQDHDLTLTIWVPREPIRESYAAAVAFVDKVMDAFPPKAKARLVDARVQHCIVMSIGAITPRTWPDGSANQFITLPVTLQVRVARAAQYQPG